MKRYRLSDSMRSVCTLLIVCFATASAQAQMFGIPPAQSGNLAWKEISGLLSEQEPLVCLIWNESGTLNPEGTESEKWYSDGRLQNSFGKLKQALVKVAQEQAPPLVARFAEDVGWKLIAKGGFLEIEQIDMAREEGNASLVVRLGDDAKLIGEFLDDLMLEGDFESKVVGENQVYTPADDDFPMAIGIHSDHLVVAVGNGQWKKITERIDNKPSTPEWLSKRLKSVPISRRGQFAFGNIKAVLEMLPSEAAEDPEFQRVRETLALDAIKSISMSGGADSTSNLSMLHIECDKEGLASILDVPAIEKAKLKEIPDDAIAALAVRLSPSKVMELVEELVPPEAMERSMADFVEGTGLDLQDDIVDHLEGTIRYYNTGMVINPKQVGIIRIKDEIKFRESFDRINDALHLMAENRGLEFVEQEKKGMKIYGIKNFGISGYWGIHEGELFLSTNSRAIGSHIRKASKVGKASLMDTEFSERILTESKLMGLKGPIMIQYYDLDQITEVVVPLIQGAFAFIPSEARDNFDFGADDFPPIESLLGLRAASSMMFKSPEGYTGISRYDTPIGVDFTSIGASGIAVGMLLPAVQQVREAARRTSSMNNQRQLVLALLNYETTNGKFPPAYTVDAAGKPLLSWRVAILPFLDQQDLYDQFHHDEPWDSDHNIELLERMPDIFANPSSPFRAGWTDYVAPMSGDSILAAGPGNKMATISDGTSNTILVMEVGTDQKVPWSSPQNLDIESLDSLDLDNGHPGTVIVAMCDGSVRNVGKNVPVEEFIQACRKSDGGVLSGNY